MTNQHIEHISHPPYTPSPVVSSQRQVKTIKQLSQQQNLQVHFKKHYSLTIHQIPWDHTCPCLEKYFTTELKSVQDNPQSQSTMKKYTTTAYPKKPSIKKTTTNHTVPDDYQNYTLAKRYSSCHQAKLTDTFKVLLFHLHPHPEATSLNVKVDNSKEEDNTYAQQL